MNAESIRKLFAEVKRGKVSPDEAVERLRHLPFEDLGFAKVDHHRTLRAGMPEVVFGQGKTPLQVATINQRKGWIFNSHIVSVSGSFMGYDEVW